MFKYRQYFFLIFLSFVISNTSYQGLLLPTNSYSLLNSNSNYTLSKNILLDSSATKKLGSTFISFPHNINIGSFIYSHKIFHKYNSQYNVTVIDYGRFVDSESNYSFSAQDLIFAHNSSIKRGDFTHQSQSIKYIHSSIGEYDANAIALEFNLYFHFNNFVITPFLKNYGIIVNSYTNYADSLPESYGASLVYKLQYLDVLLSMQYQAFEAYDEYNFYGELFIFNQSSISIGYTSIANTLYYGDFNYDLFTGINLGLNTQYKDYVLNIGVKNLGAIGTIHSISFNKLFN